MSTRRDIQCQECKNIWEIVSGMKEVIPVTCPSCSGSNTLAYFGRMDPRDIRCIGAFNPAKYNNETDANIAKFRKLHL